MPEARGQGPEVRRPSGDVLLSPTPPTILPPARLWDDPALLQIGWLLLMLLVLVPEAVIPLVKLRSNYLLGAWGTVAVLSWPQLDPRLGRRLGSWSVLCAVGLVGLLALNVFGLNWVGVALAPIAVILLAGLLPYQDTAAAAANWGIGLVAVLWAAIGLLGVAGLLTIPMPLGSAAVPVLGALIAYNAGRRAGQRQGQSDRVATGIGVTLAVAGAIALGPVGLANLALVAGLLLGILAAAAAPAPPVGRSGATTALLAAHGQLVFVAPLTFALLWLVRAVAP